MADMAVNVLSDEHVIQLKKNGADSFSSTCNSRTNSLFYTGSDERQAVIFQRSIPATHKWCFLFYKEIVTLLQDALNK